MNVYENEEQIVSFRTKLNDNTANTAVAVSSRTLPAIPPFSAENKFHG